MPLTAADDRDRQAAKRAQRPDPPAKSGRQFVPWARDHYAVRKTRAATERWQPVRYLAEIGRALTAPTHPNSAAVWKASQLGFTHLACALYAWTLLERDGRILIVMPSDIEARRFHRDRVAPIYARCPALRQLADSTVDRQAVRGIHRVFDTGASAATQGGGVADRYRSQTVDVQVLDELDGYPPELDEGDAWTLSQRATQNTGGLVLGGSTPTSARGDSQIVAAFAQADLAFVYCVRCPACGDLDDLVWERIHFAAEGSVAERAASASHTCGRCGAAWRHGRLAAAIEQGRWQEATLSAGGPPFPSPVWAGAFVKTGRLFDATGKAIPWPRHVAFAVNGLYSIWSAWPATVARWLRAQGDSRRLRAFTEQVLARPFMADGGESDVSSSTIRSHAIPLAEVPDDHRLCVCSVDVQDGWLSGHVFLFGPSESAVLVDRHEWNGDIDRVDGTAWTAFKRWLTSRPTVGGRPVRIVVVDTGFQSDLTIRNCRRLPIRTTCVKGAGGWDRPTYRRSKSVVAGFAERLFVLGVDPLKLTVAQRFAKGTMRIADHLPDEVADELAGERLKWTTQQGRRRRRWVQDGERVEALDCSVYALAAVRIANVANVASLPLDNAPARPRKTVMDRLAAAGHRVKR